MGPRSDFRGAEAAHRQARRSRRPPGWRSSWWGTIRVPRSTFATKSKPAANWEFTAKRSRRRIHHHRRAARNHRRLQPAARDRRHSGPDAVAAPGGQEPGAARHEPDKDVDGFHPLNVGALVENIPGPRACTPVGIMEMLRRYEIPVAGRRAVVVGRSDIVGKPMALLLLHADATVTICHSHTRIWRRNAAAPIFWLPPSAGARLITRDFIQPGAIVIDVGMNRKPDGKAGGRRDPDDAKALAERLHAGAGRRGSVDHRHADVQHRGDRRTASMPPVGRAE